ncbi:hypothetical protein VTK73DRAFT_5713 [Phialemonium thermophilum]|uniref:Pre-mRNA splicing factor CLF1 n=1 Tax=Phialemonium thermophilum TaxID=223376 RepID=A0ABR3XY44_9PEZI
MPVPRPPVSLHGACSVIFNNTLYTYSADAFQSLSLTPGAKWKKLPQGEPVTGGVCVGSTPGDPTVAGFYVVGGKGTTPDYQGLQKFTYSQGKWETISPLSPVTQDRVGHNAIYLNSSDEILVYAGEQDGTQTPSGDTFTIGASPPYDVASHPSTAPPAVNPILLPWSNSEAVYVGGSVTNTRVMVFSSDKEWYDSNASLSQPLRKDTSVMKAALVQGDDGSKNLYVFDTSQSPNIVNRIVLVNEYGAPVANSPPLLRRQGDSAKEGEKSAASTLTESNWPQYNSTFAPTVTRSNYALAQDSNGLVVLAGGSTQDILCMFNGRENSWRNASALFTKQKVIALSSSTTSPTSTRHPATSTAVPTMSATTTAASATETSEAPAVAPAAASGPRSFSTNAVLGITLGSIFGFAAVLILIYLLLRWRKGKHDHHEAGHVRRSSGASSSEKESIAFANDSLPRGRGTPGGGVFRGHQAQGSQASFSSMAILMGRVNQQSDRHTGSFSREQTHQKKRSSASSVFNKAFKSTISKPILQVAGTTAARPSLDHQQPPVCEDKGVSFAPDTAEPRPRPANPGKVDRQGSTRRSSGWNRYWSGGSTLNILGFGHGNGNTSGGGGNGVPADAKRMTAETDRSSNYSDRSQYRITQDSATVPPLNVYEPRASFSRVNSGSPTIAHYDSKLKESLSGQIERPVSAVSELSAYSSGIPASVHEVWDPTTAGKPWGSDRAPNSSFSGVVMTPLAPPAGSTSQQTNQAPTGVSRQPQLAVAATSSDMSWLNLGDQGNSRA